MRFTILLPAFIFFAPCTLAPADPPATQPQLTADSTLDDVLDALDARGKNLQDFSAAVKLSSVDNSIGSSTAETGKVLYRRKPDGDARIRVAFNIFDDGSKIMPQDHQYTLDGGWLVERNYDKKQEIRRQVFKPGQKMDPLKLGEGPFPLPIGQNKQDVKNLFVAAKIAPAPDDPAGTLHVQLTPKPGTSLARKFQSIDVWVDTATAMPRRIQTQENGSPITKVTDLSDVRINAGLQDKDFAEPDLPAGWETTSESYDGG
jgi:outer membrane lipoprotein-sorting protein